MRKIRIYLAGTIYNDPPDIGWKTKLVDILSGCVRWDVQSQTKSINDYSIISYDFFDPDPKNEPELYMIARDKAEISKCDIFVAYIQKPSFGTSMEIMYASLLNTKPILIINPNKLFKNDLWLRGHAHYFCDSVELCTEHIKTMRF